jgi:hypothetical protein
MNNNDKEWETLVQEWQSDSAKPLADTAEQQPNPFQLNTLSNKVFTGRRTTLLACLITFISSLILCLVLVAEIYQGLPSQYDYVLYYGLMAVFGLTCGMSIWLGISSLQVKAQNTVDYLNILANQNKLLFALAITFKYVFYAWLAMFFGIVLWILLPSLFAGTLLSDLAGIAKPVSGSIILATATIVGIAGVVSCAKVQKSFAKKDKFLRSVIKDF